MRLSFIKWLSEQYLKRDKQEIPQHWPNFLPLKVDNKHELFRKLDLDNNHQSVLIIVEKSNSFFGREVCDLLIHCVCVSNSLPLI